MTDIERPLSDTTVEEPQWAAALETIIDALEWWGVSEARGAAGRVIDRLKEGGLVIVSESAIEIWRREWEGKHPDEVSALR